ncbi:hypothetical protein Poly30_42970 [Planctomycetes bacterium Poly30]|uniref:Uncharacterized protein n=1 Tax=Saltatorellus ferox TaxID=2528018 RepID=A0A518EXD8_9BACT|nr:hypothetical protein Poly30_42970 [Planctomycetes bacterium Poly30]
MSTGEDQDPAGEGLGKELAELRNLWRQEAAEAPTLPAEPLSDADPRSQAVVHWLQAAWAEESKRTAPAALPGWAKRATPARPSRPKRWRLALHSLELIAALLIVHWLTSHAVEPANEPEQTVAGVVQPPAPVENAATRFEGDRFTASRDRIELVTGNVRVVLVQPGAPARAER